jgi:hypothetical protein
MEKAEVVMGAPHPDSHHWYPVYVSHWPIQQTPTSPPMRETGWDRKHTQPPLGPTLFGAGLGGFI